MRRVSRRRPQGHGAGARRASVQIQEDENVNPPENQEAENVNAGEQPPMPAFQHEVYIL